MVTIQDIGFCVIANSWNVCSLYKQHSTVFVMQGRKQKRIVGALANSRWGLFDTLECSRVASEWHVNEARKLFSPGLQCVYTVLVAGASLANWGQAKVSSTPHTASAWAWTKTSLWLTQTTTESRCLKRPGNSSTSLEYQVSMEWSEVKVDFSAFRKWWGWGLFRFRGPCVARSVQKVKQAVCYNRICDLFAREDLAFAQVSPWTVNQEWEMFANWRIFTCFCRRIILEICKNPQRKSDWVWYDPVEFSGKVIAFTLHKSGMKADPAMRLHSDHLGLITWCVDAMDHIEWVKAVLGDPIWKWLCPTTASSAGRKTVFLSKMWTDIEKFSGGGTGLTGRQVVHHVLRLSPRECSPAKLCARGAEKK